MNFSAPKSGLMGVEAILNHHVNGGGCFEVYSDDHNNYKTGDTGRHYAMVVESGSHSQRISVIFGVTSDPVAAENIHKYLAQDCFYAYSLTIDGNVKIFRCCKPSELTTKDHVFSVADKSWTSRGSNGRLSVNANLNKLSTVQLKLYRVKYESDDAGVRVVSRDKDDLGESQVLSGWKKKFEVGSYVLFNGTHVRELMFCDCITEPWVSYTWTFKPTRSLQLLGKKPRTPDLPQFQILPHEKLCGSFDLNTRIGSKYLTHGLSLSEIEYHAVQKLYGMISEEKPAGVSIFEHVYPEVNKRCLRVLVVFNDDDNTSGYDGIAMATANRTDLDGMEQTKTIRATLMLEALSEISNPSLHAGHHLEILSLCKTHTSLNSDQVDKLPAGDLVPYAANRIVEDQYLNAMVEVLRVLAEERLEEEQLGNGGSTAGKRPMEEGGVTDGPTSNKKKKTQAGKARG